MKAPAAKPASRQNEFTVPAIVLSLILSVVMGAANVYLGLRAGMTVSASIPAAVISMALFQGVLRRKNILESNLVQTCASAGESLAAGIIFTIPALVLVGVWEHFNFWTTTLIALTGGLIGILFMIPMRRVFILESPELKFPEGVACAAVLTAGRDGVKAGATLVFAGVVVGAVFKFFASMLGLFKQTVEWAWFSGSRVFYLGSDLSPVLLGVGMIVGLDISFQMFLGGAIGWLILIPLLQADPTQGGALDEAWRLWESQIKYVGVGAMIVGGLVSIWNVRSGLLAAVKELGVLIQSHADPKVEVETERQLNGKTILILLVLSILMTAGVYYVSLGHDLGITVLITI
ncbi:MAG: oligopeptide transporter, OPT family, partial [bacterium]|nr:oligopeptide transporter, OPT family [bacterium]